MLLWWHDLCNNSYSAYILFAICIPCDLHAIILYDRSYYWSASAANFAVLASSNTCMHGVCMSIIPVSIVLMQDYAP